MTHIVGFGVTVTSFGSSNDPLHQEAIFLYIFVFIFWRIRKLIWNCVIRFDNVKWDSIIRRHCNFWSSAVSTVIMLLSGRSGDEIQVEASDFYLLQIVHNGRETHTAVCTERYQCSFAGAKPF
jgi:hypothetical protein